MATINMHMKFEIEMPKQTWLMLRKPCRLQTEGRTERRTDKVNPVYPPSNFVGQGYDKLIKICTVCNVRLYQELSLYILHNCYTFVMLLTKVFHRFLGWWLSHLYNGNPHTCKTASLYWISLLWHLLLTRFNFNSIMMLMKFSDLSQSDRSNWVMWRQVKDPCPRPGWDGCLTREKWLSWKV